MYWKIKFVCYEGERERGREGDGREKVLNCIKESHHEVTTALIRVRRGNTFCSHERGEDGGEGSRKEWMQLMPMN